MQETASAGSDPSADATRYLADFAAGRESASDDLFPLVYAELHALAERSMRQERANHTLQPTALVHEAYLRLIDQRTVEWQGPAHFFAVAATIIRRILLQHARDRRAAKRGGGARRVEMSHDLAEARESAEIDLLALDDALEQLQDLNERQARVVELRYFGGLGVDDTARLLGVSPRTVKGEWRLARAWLRGRLES